jgi:hypothetical protein
MPPGNQPEEVIGFDEGWGQLSKFILRSEILIFDKTGRILTKDECSAHYKIVYTMATQKAPMHFAEALYNQLIVEISAVAARRRSTATKEQIETYAKLIGNLFKYIDWSYVDCVGRTPTAQVVENSFNLL